MNNDLRAKAKSILRELATLHPKAKIALKFRTNWELLVAVILSAQCTDKKVNEVTARLFSAKGARLPDGQGSIRNIRAR